MHNNGSGSHTDMKKRTKDSDKVTAEFGCYAVDSAEGIRHCPFMLFAFGKTRIEFRADGTYGTEEEAYETVMFIKELMEMQAQSSEDMRDARKNSN